jgi:hypothetical protein
MAVSCALTLKLMVWDKQGRGRRQQEGGVSGMVLSPVCIPTRMLQLGCQAIGVVPLTARSVQDWGLRHDLLPEHMPGVPSVLVGATAAGHVDICRAVIVGI